MTKTMTFTQENINELMRISELNIFASKIAKTILSKDEYIASAKQVDILNEISEIEFFISNNYSEIYADEARIRRNNNLPSSLR